MLTKKEYVSSGWVCDSKQILTGIGQEDKPSWSVRLLLTSLCLKIPIRCDPWRVGGWSCS